MSLPLPELLAEFNRLGIEVWADGDQLRIRAPKGAVTPELRTTLAERKAELLDLLRQRPRIAPDEGPSPLVTTPNESQPLSFSQQRFWLLDQIEAGNASYNVPMALHLVGQLDEAALVASLNHIWQRHAVLRTTLKDINGQPVQSIAPAAPLIVPLVALRDEPDSTRNAEAERLIREAVQTPFDLATGPLLRASLLRLADEEHILLVTMHHTICDGYSTPVLLGELTALYGAFQAGQPSPLPPLPVQYSDYARWQRQHLTPEVLAPQLVYWQEHLAGAPSALDLPTDAPRPPLNSYRGGWRSVILPQSLVEPLRGMSRSQGATPFMTMLAALHTLLYAWTDATDMVVGTIVNNRTTAETERLIGDFTNFLPLRTRFEPTQTGEALLAQVRATVLASRPHQECPFDKIVEAINPDRKQNQSPLYNVAFFLQSLRGLPGSNGADSPTPTVNPFPQLDAPSSRVALNAALQGTVLMTRTLSQSTMLDIRFEAYEYDHHIYLGCEYSTDLFTQETIDHVLQAYTEVLQTLVQRPEQQLQAFRLPAALATQRAASREREQRGTVAISATFTAEPLEESLTFWMEELGLSGKVRFAPYNQPFQQLLDPGSLLNTNRGINVLLVRFEDWLRHQKSPILSVEPDQKERLLANRSRHTLPNTMEIAHITPYETEYLYQEIFVLRAYLNHGITIEPGDCVFDVGANIGLFSLFVQQYYPNTTVYAFEPAPPVFDALQTNTQLYGANVKPLNYGLSDSTREATLTFYQNSSALSSYYADQVEDEAVIHAIISNKLKQQTSDYDPATVKQLSDELVSSGQRLAQQRYTTQLRTISSVIREHGVQQIDLLKIDAEKSELDVLRGVETEHWPLIKQLVVEVDDRTGARLQTIIALLEAQGFTIAIEEESYLQGSRFYTLYATRPRPDTPTEALPGLNGSQATTGDSLIHRQIEQALQELVQALRGAARQTSTPFLVCSCPASPETMANKSEAAFFEDLEVRLAAALADLPTVSLIPSSEITQRYPVTTSYDAHADKLGHVPYTPAGFAAIGSTLARKLYALQRPPFKVVVLDCDQTLWKGVCGEDGPLGVELDRPRQALQAFMVEQQAAGMLLAVCSKNDPADVEAVWERRTDMILTREHIVAWRVNWQPKSENLKALAQELNLGLDSFLFIDDNPVECAEVRANCPEVLTLQLPSDPERIPHFLRHVWAFDRLRLTSEDAQRTALYQQNVARERARSEALTFADFLESLKLQVQISPMAPHHLARVAQLTQRTNQFNCTTVRRTEAEIQRLCQTEGYACLAVDVSDRFGAYGLVGVVIFKADASTLAVDTFLLSCRVLGKGVEHQIVAHLGALAESRGLETVTLAYQPTAKNQPALDFLTSLGARQTPMGAGWTFALSSAQAARTSYTPPSTAPATVEEEPRPTVARAVTHLHHTPSDVLGHIATDLAQVDNILKRIESRRYRARGGKRGSSVPPQTPTEQRLADLWSSLLGVEGLGIHDNFFALGGHSLLAIQMLARIRDSFSVELSLPSLIETPTIAGLAERLASTPAASQSDTGQPVLPTIVPAPEDRYLPFPLTDIQQAYWIGRSGTFELGNVASHVYFELEANTLDLDRLTQAWRQVIARHDMLRAIILPSGEQQILPLAEVPPYEIEFLDLRGQAPASIERATAEVRQQMSHQVLPADQWPLFELRATQLDEQRTRLHISFDLLIIDIWSMLSLFREWSDFYQDPTLTLPPIEITFRDYVLAEAALRDTEFYRRSERYWLERIPTLPPAPELPLAQNPSALVQPRFERRSARLAPELWQPLKQQAAQLGVTPSGILLAAFSEVLAVWSKNPRFTINLTLFNRVPLHPQVNDLVGDFTSLTLLAVDCMAEAHFAERVQRIQQQLWQDIDHRYLGGIQVQRELARQQRGPRQVMMPIVFTSALGPATMGQEAARLNQFGEITYSIGQTPQVWLDHQVFEQEGTLVFNWDSVDGLFPEGMLDDMFAAYNTLLQRLISDSSLWQAPMVVLPPARQLAQRAEVNATEAPVPSGLLHTLVLEQVAGHRDDPAVITSRRTLSYGELARRATQAAHRLRALGVQPNTLVGVVMDKGWEQVVATLAILQAGGAYLPINPDLPEERLHYLLQHGQVQVVLTQSWIDQRLHWPDGLQRLVIDTDDLAAEPLPVLAPVQQPTDLAYVIFTSGSTGLPKGVMIDHRGAVNTIVDLNQRFHLSPADRVLALSSLSFDLSVYDIFGLLAAGGAIVIPDHGTARDPSHWAQMVTQHGVTIWNTVPALMQMLADYLDGRGERLAPALRLVMMSGDWLPLTLPAQIRRLTDQIELYSLGGATEASIWSILYPIDQVSPDWKSIPYGKPMVNQSFHVLDERLAPCPVWVPGQLYIGGIGLAQGYWRDPLKTNASFLTHPRTGERLYKTGDLGRYLPDGNIEFLGREDFQVKISGHRIELGEIEAALSQHPGVREVVVAAVGETKGAKQLVAYIVPEQAATGGGQQTLADAIGPEKPEGILADPVERVAFKLRQPGLRPAEPGRAIVPLGKPALDPALTASYLARQSYRHFQPETLTLEGLSAFLSSLMALPMDGSPLPKYRYASAGSLYPVQVYLHVKAGRIAGLDGGLYYYHPVEHQLCLLAPGVEMERGWHAEPNWEIFDASAFSIFLVGQLDAIEPLYGEVARDFCLLEAGYISQLLMSAAPSHDIGLCPVGGLNFAAVRGWANLSERQILLHTLVGGRIAPAQQARWGEPAQPQSSDLSDAGLRRYLQSKLPAYMVPTNYMLLERLPLTSNGKVDRQALPTPEASPSQASYTPPETEVERILVEIVQAVLQVEQVGIHDNFFDLGANSVHLVQVHSRLRAALNQEIPITEVFRYPTIQSLATYLGQQTPSEQTTLQESQDRGEARRALRRRRQR